MPRIPIYQRRRYSLVQIPKHQRAHTMANPPPNMNNHQGNQTVFFIQPPLPQNHQPLSWIEKALMVHAVSFNMILDGQDTMIILQNSHFLAHLVSEGLHMSMSNYYIHVWLDNILQPLAPNLNAQ